MLGTIVSFSIHYTEHPIESIMILYDYSYILSQKYAILNSNFNRMTLCSLASASNSHQVFCRDKGKISPVPSKSFLECNTNTQIY